MTNRKVILYIACSLDGYIAKENDDIGFLSMLEKQGEDYGYHEFIKTVDTVIMGRKTYDKVLSFGIDFPYHDKECYVLTRTKKGKDNNVEFFNGELSALLSKIRQSEGKDIFIAGGAELVFGLMKHNLIDRFIISFIPVFLGNGIPLFKPGRKEQILKLIDCKYFESGLVQICYDTVR